MLSLSLLDRDEPIAARELVRGFSLAQIARRHLLKEQLREVFKTKGYRAVFMIDDWLAWASRSKLAPFVKLARAIRHHRRGIESALVHGRQTMAQRSEHARLADSGLACADRVAALVARRDQPLDRGGARCRDPEVGVGDLLREGRLGEAPAREPATRRSPPPRPTSPMPILAATHHASRGDGRRASARPQSGSPMAITQPASSTIDHVAR